MSSVSKHLRWLVPICFWIAVVGAILIFRKPVEVLPFYDFQDRVRSRQVETAEVNGDEVRGKLAAGTKYRTTIPEGGFDVRGFVQDEGHDLQVTEADSVWESVLKTCFGVPCLIFVTLLLLALVGKPLVEYFRLMRYRIVFPDPPIEAEERPLNLSRIGSSPDVIAQPDGLRQVLLVAEAASSESIGDARWRLRIRFAVYNQTEYPVALDRMKTLVYCDRPGVSVCQDQLHFDARGETRLDPARCLGFELVIEVANRGGGSSGAHLRHVTIFGLSLDYRLVKDQLPMPFCAVSDCICCLQDLLEQGHLVRLTKWNLPDYLTKHRFRPAYKRLLNDLRVVLERHEATARHPPGQVGHDPVEG